MQKPEQKNLNDYKFFQKFSTRWRDNDVYGHMNNVVFYEFVDSTVNNWLNIKADLKVPNSSIIGLVVETKCNFFLPLCFPQEVNCGLVSNSRGNSSVSYEVGLFKGSDHQTAAIATFVHVYVDAESRRPVPLPEKLARALTEITLIR